MNRKLKENFLRKVVFPAKNILNLSFKVQCQGSIRRSNNHKLFLFLPLLKENDSGMKKRTIRIKREYLKGFLEKARDKVIIFFLHFLTFLWHFLKDRRNCWAGLFVFFCRFIERICKNNVYYLFFFSLLELRVLLCER